MKKEVIIAQLGRIFILIAIILSVVNAFYWKNNIIDGVSVIFAFLSLVMVLFVTRKFRKDYKNSTLGIINQQLTQNQLINIVYKSSMQYNFESLPMAVEEKVKEEMPFVQIDDLLKVFDYVKTIPKEINIYCFNKHFKNQEELYDSKLEVKTWIKTKYLWMDEESLELSFNYFFKSKIKN